MKTRDRILATSLTLFNQRGEPHVSTNHIADEMDISPGNLYYHFRNKEQIVEELFDQFRKRMEHLLMAPDSESASLDDVWLFLHLLFEIIWEYRFLYRNLVDLTQRMRSLRIHFHHLIRQKREAAVTICKGLEAAGAMQIGRSDMDDLATSIALVTTYWMNFQTVEAIGVGDAEVASLSPGAYQVMTLLAPWLREPHRQQLVALAGQYRTRSGL